MRPRKDETVYLGRPANAQLDGKKSVPPCDGRCQLVPPVFGCLWHGSGTDGSANLKLVERILAQHGRIELISAMHGQLGLELARQYRPPSSCLISTCRAWTPTAFFNSCATTP